MKLGFAEKQFFKLRFFFAHAWTAFNRTWNIVYPITQLKAPSRASTSAGIELLPFEFEVLHANHYATGALLSRNFVFSLSLFPLAAKGWV
jgi:hypothetical protein